MTTRPVPARHWRSYGTLPTAAEAMNEPFRAFPSWFLRIDDAVHTRATEPRLPLQMDAATIPPMCGLYASFLPAEAMARIFGTTNPLQNLAPSWNVAPTQDAAVVRGHPQTGERHLDLLTWGLLPYWTKELSRARRPINARSETAATSGMFKDALARRRCLVPADAFYEWKVVEGGKQPCAIARQDGQPMAFGGL
jgi:hypothetical protein